MQTDDQAWEGARALCGAGVLRGVRRAGFTPVLWKEEIDIELEFDAGDVMRTFRVMVGPMHASDIQVAEGEALDLAFGHLREEGPESYAETLAGWRLFPEPDAQWAIGTRLANPVRLKMSVPYSETVGFAFDCERDGAIVGRLMLFGEADVLFAVRDNHPEVAKYGLTV